MNIETGVIIKFIRLSPSAKLPSYVHPHDAGMDVYSNEDYALEPGETHLFSTGIASEFPQGYAALVWDKGSMGAKGIHHFAGVIDAGYRGEWFICLHNMTDKEYMVEKGYKIAQVLIQKVERAVVQEADSISHSSRGEGKLGSTGRK